MLLSKKKGQGMVEYALIIVFMAVIVLVAIQFLSGAIQDLFLTGVRNALIDL